jgi:hypothetical protein
MLIHSRKQTSLLHLDAFLKLWKATISFMAGCLSVRMEQLGSHWKDFNDIWHLSSFENVWRKFSWSKGRRNIAALTAVRKNDVKYKSVYFSRSFWVNTKAAKKILEWYKCSEQAEHQPAGIK